MSEIKENLWAKAFREYWADPKNVIGPPGAFIRRLIKFMWIALAVYVLFFVAGPSQVASWRLWMVDDALASHLAWAFTFASALCFTVVSYASQDAPPIRVPVFLPTFESWRGWRTAHLHIPSVRVLCGSAVALALFAMAFLGQWNYYLHDNLQTGGASVAALSSSGDRVADAERALAQFEERTGAAAAAATLAIQQTSAGSPTGRSRLVRQQAEAAAIASQERAALQAELREARAATVTTHQSFTDPRPVDGMIAGGTGWTRSFVSSLLDAIRSGVVEALLIMGAGLGIAAGTSRVGVPRETFTEHLTEEDNSAAETLAENEPAPAAEPEPPPRRRFTLPTALEEDFAAAAVVGPVAAVIAQPEPEADPEPQAEPEPAAATVDEPVVEEEPAAPANEVEMDPLVAEQLNAQTEAA